MKLYLLLLIVFVIILGGLANYYLPKKPKIKPFVTIFFSIIIIVLGYLLYESILNPIRFESEKTKRYNATIQRLIDIRTAQNAYKEENGQYADNFDKLIEFINTDSFEIKKPIDKGWDQDEYTEEEAIRLGLLEYEINKVSVKDSLFSHTNIDSIKYVPFTEGKEFELGAAEIVTASKVKVQVFEAKVHNNILLSDLDRQLVINLNDERRKIEQYPGLKVGSLTEATNNSGNWE
ncbi:MAG: hypothetical protein JXB17_03965 [Bacteroidales bacterium]|nr:hypothetical protein [Bacteroidales bacterium]